MHGLFILPLFLVLVSSCVHVQVSPKKSPEEVNSPEATWNPVPPRTELFTLDKAHDKKRTFLISQRSHLFSALPSCQAGSDLRFEAFASQTLQQFSTLDRSSSEMKVFQDRKALYLEAEGFFDGRPLKLIQWVIKKNGCTFLFTYSGPPLEFDSKVRFFNDWVQSQDLP